MIGGSGLLGVETAVQHLAQEMARAVPVTIVGVALWDQPSFSLTVRAASAAHTLPAPLPIGARLPLATARWHRTVFERQQPVLLEQDAPGQSVSFDDETSLALAPNLRSIYLMPIRVGEETVGVLGLGEMRSRAREPFTEEKRERCRAVLEEFLATSAPAWEAARLRRQIRAMSSLLWIVRQIIQARTYEDIIGCCASEVADWLGTPVHGILLRSRGGAMDVVGQWRAPESLLEAGGTQLSMALARAGQGRWPLSVVPVREDPLDPLYAAAAEGTQRWTRVGLPLMQGDRLLGLACLYVEDDLHPSEWELEAFRRRADIAAVGVGIVEALEEHRAEHERLGRTAYELLTTYKRVVIHETLAGIMNLIAALLPARMAKAATEMGGAAGPAFPDWPGLTDLVAREIAGLLSELQAATRSTASDESLPNPLDVNGLVRRAVEIARATLEEGSARGGASIEVEFEPAAEPLVADTSLALVGAVVHAIENAVEAMPGGGQIHVRTGRDDGHLVISIGDTGPGVAEEFHRDAFAPLVSTKGGPHLGLGLAVVQALAQRHGGEASLGRTEVGGARLVIRLPARAERAWVAPEAPAVLRSRAGA